MEAKKKSVIQTEIDKMLNAAAVLETIESVFHEDTYMSCMMDRVEIWPNNDDESRRIVGGLILLLRSKPAIKKYGATDLEASFNCSGYQIVVNKYRGRKCAIVKKRIVHEAVPEKTEITPAKEAYVEEVEELVCEMDDVEREVTPTPEPVEVSESAPPRRPQRLNNG